MNISGYGGNYNQCLNRLSPMKSYVKQSLERSDTKKSSIDMDKILYSGKVVKSHMKNYTGTPITECEIVPSSKREYTMEDAIRYQYNKQFTIRLDDLINGKYENMKLTMPAASVPQEFIDSLKQNGLKDDEFDSGRIQFYLMGLNCDTSNIQESVDYLASGYSVCADHIRESNLDEEKEQQLLSDLKAKFDSAIESIAKKASEEIGGFFEEGGVTGETQKIYDSVMKAYNDSVNNYSNYIKENKDYANLGGTEDEWLKNDDSYMACQLRRSIQEDTTIESSQNKSEYYSLEELEKTKQMISEVEDYKNYGAREINYYDSEEEIGFKLAELSLKGEVFQKYSDVSDSLKNAVAKSIQKFVSNTVDRLNKELKEARSEVAEPSRMADIDEREVFSVYKKMMNTYKTTGDMIKALKEGARFAKEQHMNKTKTSRYSSLNRYGRSGSAFWNNFFQNTLKYREDAVIPSLSNTNGYIDKESGIETLSKNWNQFISQFTDNDDLRLNISSFLGYA